MEDIRQESEERVNEFKSILHDTVRGIMNHHVSLRDRVQALEVDHEYINRGLINGVKLRGIEKFEVTAEALQKVDALFQAQQDHAGMMKEISSAIPQISRSKDR